MVLIETDKTKLDLKEIETDKTKLDLEGFDKVLESIPKEIEGLAEPPENLMSKMDDKQKVKYEKEKSKWMNKLMVNYNVSRLKKVVGLKESYTKTQTEIEKDFIYKPGFLEKINSKVLGRNYLRIMVIMPNGVMKEFNKPIKTNYVKLLQGRYVIQLKAMIKYKGKNTLFYHQGNPFPITFDSDKYPYIVNAESLENMFNSNIVSQIFAGLSLGKSMFIGFGILAGIALVIASVLMFGPAAIKETASGVLIWKLNKKT